MPKYAIVPNRVILVDGQTVTPEDQVGTIDCDLSVHDVLALLQFKNASLVEIEADDEAEADADDSDSDLTDPPDQTDLANKDANETETMQKPFASYSAKTQAVLAKAGITTLPQAALWLRDNQDFTKLGLAKGVASELLKQITEANIPTT